MSKKAEIDEDENARKRLFKPKSISAVDGNGAENDLYKEVLKRRPKKKEVRREVQIRRVKDLLNSFSKFDEDIWRLKGIKDETSESDEINNLSIEEMQEELQKFLLDRDRIIKNLENLVVRVNRTTDELKLEEEKIKKLKEKIQLKTEKFSNTGRN